MFCPMFVIFYQVVYCNRFCYKLSSIMLYSYCSLLYDDICCVFILRYIIVYYRILTIHMKF